MNYDKIENVELIIEECRVIMENYSSNLYIGFSQANKVINACIVSNSDKFLSNETKTAFKNYVFAEVSKFSAHQQPHERDPPLPPDSPVANNRTTTENSAHPSPQTQQQNRNINNNDNNSNNNHTDTISLQNHTVPLSSVAPVPPPNDVHQPATTANSYSMMQPMQPSHTQTSGGQNKTNRTIQYVGNTVIMYFCIFSQLYCIFENKNTLRVKMQFTGIDFYRRTLCPSSLTLKRIGLVIKIHSPSMPMYPFFFYIGCSFEFQV
jgi:hypothetical protein